jgi:hypothetical protein
MLQPFPIGMTNPTDGGLGIIQTDLFMLYDFNDNSCYPGTGTAVTDLKGNFDATLFNGVGYSTGNGGELVFDGVDDYGNIDSGFMTGLTNATMTAWFYYEDNGRWTRVWDFGANTNNYVFLTPRNGQSYSGTYAIDTLRVAYRVGGGSETLVNMPTQLTNNTWNEVTVTFSGTTMTMYHNGSSIGSVTNGNTLPNLGTTSNNYIGKAQFPDPYYKGKMGAFFVYNATLNSTQVSDNFNAVRSRYGI